MRKWLGNAFTVGDEGAPCDEDLAALERLAQFIVTRNLEAPAILFLQSAIPISFIGSQVMVALEPFVNAFYSYLASFLRKKTSWQRDDFGRLARIFERRDGIERLTKRIEQLVEEKDAELKKG